MTITNYRVGIVLSQAGMNAAQLAEVKSRLRTIAKVTNDKVAISAPTFHPKRVTGAPPVNVRALLEPIAKLDHVCLTVLDHVHSIEDIVRVFHHFDEVWCLSSGDALASSRAHKAMVHVKRLGDVSQSRKYKLIPPWTAPTVPEAKEPKTH